MLDLVLAVAHHLLIFMLAGVLTAELVMLRPGLDAGGVRRIAAIDMWYGLLAGLILAVGFSRAIFAAKGWDYYSHNLFFWGKLSAFAVIGILSIWPTMGYLRRKRAGSAPDDGQVAGLRRYLWAQVMLFPLLLIFAAAMARGYGELGS